jgi:hypothetical protein
MHVEQIEVTSDWNNADMGCEFGNCDDEEWCPLSGFGTADAKFCIKAVQPEGWCCLLRSIFLRPLPGGSGVVEREILRWIDNYRTVYRSMSRTYL